jgi:hypothetical protein
MSEKKQAEQAEAKKRITKVLTLKGLCSTEIARGLEIQTGVRAGCGGCGGCKGTPFGFGFNRDY